MDKADVKSFDIPDEVREFANGRLELLNIGGAIVGRAVLEPGWRWATSIQSIAGTKSCEAPHFQYHVAGVLRVKWTMAVNLIAAPAICHASSVARRPGRRG